MNTDVIVLDNKIKNKIYTIRGLQVILDNDLAELYQVETRTLNQAVKRNLNRFPDEFMFQLSKEELENLKSQIVISSSDSQKQYGGRRYLPYVFTEQGVSMLSAVLKSKIAVEVSINIVKAFIDMRKFISSNSMMLQRFENIEQKLLKHDDNFNKIFKAIESKEIKPKQGIFYDGQIFDAYVFVSKLIKSAQKSIILIDNYVDENTLTLLSKRSKNCETTIYTKTIPKKLKLDIKKHNEQYSPIKIKEFKNSHDRFLILDNNETYHIGASLKDLGKKWFAFSKFDRKNLEILERLN